MARKKGDKLPRGFITERSEKFVDNMAKLGMSKTDAAKEAGYSKGYQEANRLLKKSEIYKKIEERKMQAADFARVTPEQIIGATALRAFATIDDAFDENGDFDINKARRTGAIHLIKKLEKTQHGFKVEFYSNETAQEKLGNYLGLDKAPADNNDIQSLKLAIEEVAKSLADGEEVTFDHRRQAWGQILNWATERRARYSQQAIQEIQRQFDEQRY